MMVHRTGLFLVPLLILLLNSGCLPTGEANSSGQIRPRILVTTDIGGDPDDTQSMIRLLLYSCDLDIVGLIASASGTLGELDTAVVRTDLLVELVELYAEVYPNLRAHHSEYPQADSLLGFIKAGNPHRGMDFVGEGHDTQGSEWIEKQILKEDDRPLDICIWGGQTDLFQALWSLKDSLGEDQFTSLTQHIRIYNINDQDRIHSQFRKAFPGLFHILAKAPEGEDKREGAYRGMYLGGNEGLTSRAWINAHVKENHGPLGAAYPDRTWTAPNPHGCLKEGDTPSWFYFLARGLQDPWKPTYGGWGGRFRSDTARYYMDDHDQLGKIRNARATVWRWRPVFQADFQARMDWCVMPVEKANHPPQISVNGNERREVLYLDRKGRKTIMLDASTSTDPDGDALSYRWWIYAEPTDLSPEALPPSHRGPQLEWKANMAVGKEIHLILEVSDTGMPALTSMRRVVLRPG